MGAYIRKLKRGTKWRYVGSYLGVQYVSKAIYKTKQQALKAERNKKEEIENKLITGEITLKELIEERLDDIKAKRSKRYYDENQRYLKNLLNEFGDIDIAGITRRELNQFINRFALDLKKRGKTFEKANAMIRILKALFNTASMKNPVIGIEFYPIDKRLKHIPANEEIETVLLACDVEQQDLIIFALETGCRINEALRLTYDDVFDINVVLYTRKSKNSNLTSRKVEYIIGKKGKGRVFKRWDDYPKFLERKAKTWAWHNLRHRKASWMSKQNRPLFEIMMQLGHQNIGTTQKYLQLLP